MITVGLQLQGSRYKTLSGLAQHLEAGLCTGGREGLGRIARIFEEEPRREVACCFDGIGGESFQVLKEWLL